MARRGPIVEKWSLKALESSLELEIMEPFNLNSFTVILENLSTRVFETRTVTGSHLLSLLTCPHTTIFTLLSIFSSLEMSNIKIWETIRS